MIASQELSACQIEMRMHGFAQRHALAKPTGWLMACVPLETTFAPRFTRASPSHKSFPVEVLNTCDRRWLDTE